MDYKKKYKKQKEKNKSLMDRIEELKLDIAELSIEREASIERVQELVDELEDIRLEFLLVINELDRCKESYIMIKKMIIQNKKIAILGFNIVDGYLEFKYKLKNLFKRKRNK